MTNPKTSTARRRKTTTMKDPTSVTMATIAAAKTQQPTEKCNPTNKHKTMNDTTMTSPPKKKRPNPRVAAKPPPPENKGTPGMASIVTASPTDDKATSSTQKQANKKIMSPYEQWKNHCNVSVSHYLNQRFHQSTDSESTPTTKNDAGSPKDVDNKNGRKSNRKSRSDTNSKAQIQVEQQNKESDANKERNKNKSEKASSKATEKGGEIVTPTKQNAPLIPHVSLCNKPCTNFSNVDLYSSTLSLNLCQIQKVYPLRLTKRWESWFASSNVSYDGTSFNTKKDRLQLPPLPQPPITNTPEDLTSPSNKIRLHDDGPLFPLYKRVLSLEVVQMLPSGETSAPFTMYCYNQYANFLDKYLTTCTKERKRKHKKNAVFLSLQNIPSCCVIPYSSSGEYSIAIGGPSRAMRMKKKTNENNSTSSEAEDRLSFDSPELKVCLVSELLHIAKTVTRFTDGHGAVYPEVDEEETTEEDEATEELRQLIHQWDSSSVSATEIVTEESEQSSKNVTPANNKRLKKRRSSSTLSPRKRLKQTGAVVSTPPNRMTPAADIIIDGYDQLVGIVFII